MASKILTRLQTARPRPLRNPRPLPLIDPGNPDDQVYDQLLQLLPVVETLLGQINGLLAARRGGR